MKRLGDENQQKIEKIARRSPRLREREERLLEEKRRARLKLCEFSEQEKGVMPYDYLSALVHDNIGGFWSFVCLRECGLPTDVLSLIIPDIHLHFCWRHVLGVVKDCQAIRSASDEQEDLWADEFEIPEVCLE
jgi:hypothetical protein